MDCSCSQEPTLPMHREKSLFNYFDLWGPLVKNTDMFNLRWGNSYQLLSANKLLLVHNSFATTAQSHYWHNFTPPFMVPAPLNYTFQGNRMEQQRNRKDFFLVLFCARSVHLWESWKIGWRGGQSDKVFFFFWFVVLFLRCSAASEIWSCIVSSLDRRFPLSWAKKAKNGWFLFLFRSRYPFCHKCARSHFLPWRSMGLFSRTTRYRSVVSSSELKITDAENRHWRVLDPGRGMEQ